MISNAVQLQRDTDGVNDVQEEARADKRWASAKESGAVPGFFVRVCVERGIPGTMKADDVAKPGDSEREKPEDLELGVVEEVRRAEQQDGMMGYELQPQATPQTFAPPMPPSHLAEERNQRERVVEYEAPSPLTPPPPPSRPALHGNETGRAAGRRNNGLPATTVAAADSRNCNAG